MSQISNPHLIKLKNKNLNSVQFNAMLADVKNIDETKIIFIIELTDK